MPRSVFMQIVHENHEFACAKINAIDFVCINCCWNEVQVISNHEVLTKQVTGIRGLERLHGIAYNRNVNKEWFLWRISMKK